MRLDRKTVLVSDTGGSLDIVSNDGEILASIAVPPGRVKASHYFDLVPGNASLQVADGLAVVQPRIAVGIQRYGAGSHDSGANPDFRPTSASRMEREMRLTLSRMQAATDRLERRERSLAQVERIPKASASDPVEVIEPELEKPEVVKTDE